MANYQLSKVSDKTAADFDELEPHWAKRLEVYDKKKNHNKFWHVAVYGQYIVRRWGRHGSKGQSLVECTSSEYGAKNIAQDMAWAKEKKGYKPEVGTLEKIVREMDE